MHSILEGVWEAGKSMSWVIKISHALLLYCIPGVFCLLKLLEENIWELVISTLSAILSMWGKGRFRINPAWGSQFVKSV